MRRWMGCVFGILVYFLVCKSHGRYAEVMLKMGVRGVEVVEQLGLSFCKT